MWSAAFTNHYSAVNAYLVFAINSLFLVLLHLVEANQTAVGGWLEPFKLLIFSIHILVSIYLTLLLSYSGLCENIAPTLVRWG